MMNVQYISDESGQQTAVIIPISEWNSINLRLNNTMKITQAAKKPSDFRGCISKETANTMTKYIEESKSEWERNIS